MIAYVQGDPESVSLKVHPSSFPRVSYSNITLKVLKGHTDHYFSSGGCDGCKGGDETPVMGPWTYCQGGRYKNKVM